MRPIAAAFAFSLLLLLPGLALRSGLLSFDLRFEALLTVSLVCIGGSVVAGFTRAELGLGVALSWRAIGRAAPRSRFCSRR